MAAYADTFKRKEVKYRLDAGRYAYMRDALEGHMVLDRFGVTRVTSLYLDTPDRSLIARSLEKPLYKEKLRVRAYGRAGSTDRVFVELKKKYKGIVYKRRVAMSLAGAQAFLSGVPYERACARFPLPDELEACECLLPHNVQMAREIEGMRKRWEPLGASMEIACDRMAFTTVLADGGETGDGSAPAAANPEAGDVRITFDTDIAYRDMFAMFPATGEPPGSGRPRVRLLADGDCLGSDAGDPRGIPERGMRPLLEPGEAVMEIKVLGAMPLWLTRALDGACAYPSSFSKYGAAYRRCLKEAIHV